MKKRTRKKNGIAKALAHPVFHQRVKPSIEKAKKDPAYFVENIMGHKLEKWQKGVLRKLADKD